MKIKLLIMTAIMIFVTLNICGAQAVDALHTPKKGSAERQKILNALRGDTTDIKFQVDYLKVHNGWAWIDATPLDARGQAVAEGGASLLHLEGNVWKVMDLSIVPEDPHNPLGAQDLSKVYLANLRKFFRGAPMDIFPKAGF